MANPRILIHSTYQDLAYFRGPLESLVHVIGFDPILFELPTDNRRFRRPFDESLLDETGHVDMLVLIVGGQCGEDDGELPSPTTAIFRDAQARSIPVFVMVEAGTLEDYLAFSDSKMASTASYPHVDSIKVFRLLETFVDDEEQLHLQPFTLPEDITQYLRQQWAGLFAKLIAKSHPVLGHVYLSDATAEEGTNVLSAIEEMCRGVGLDVRLVSQHDGSWIAKIISRLTIDPVLLPFRLIQRALEIFAAGKQAPADHSWLQGTAALLDSLGENSAVVQIGTVLLLKLPSSDQGRDRIVVRQLSQSELLHLQENPHYLNQPDALLDALKSLPQVNTPLRIDGTA